MVDIPYNLLPNITYDANGNILVNGAPIPGTGPVDLDITPGTFSTTNAAGVPYVPSGDESNLDVDYTDAMAMLNSPFAQTSVFNDPDLDGFEDATGTPNLFEDLLLQGAATRVGLNNEELPPPPVPVEPYSTAHSADYADTDWNPTDNIDGPPPPPPPPGTTMDDLVNFLTEGGLGSGANWLREGSMTADEIREKYLSGDRLNEFNALMANFDPSTYTYEGDTLTYNPYNQDFGAETGMNKVYFINPITGQAQFLSANEAAALGVDPSMMYTNSQDLLNANPQLNEQGTLSNTEPEPSPTSTGPNYQDLFQNLVQEYQSLLNQQNQPTQTTQTTDMSGLMGLFSGGNPFYRQPSYGYGGGMGYGNPFSGGYGYGYGMNPYAGGIGSFYGNMGSGYSPSMYGSPFYGMYGGQNYNQRNNYMPYNPYSTLYNQYTSPGYTGDMYTTDYQSYLDTPFEGQKYSQDYQDYLSTNNPSVYNNLFGTA